MKTAYIMPAYNEEELLAETVAEVLPWVDLLLIINDGSRDATPQIADALRAQHPDRIEVIHHAKNKGIGAGVVSGLRALLPRAGIDAIGIIASDKQCDPALLPRFQQLLSEDPAIDVAKGSRFLHPQSLYQMPRFRYWGNRGVTATMRLILGYHGMSDVLHGYMLVRKSVLQSVDLTQIADGYDLETTLMAELRRLRSRFALVPSPSRYGREKSKIVYHQQIPKTLRTFGTLFKHRLLFGHAVDRLSAALLIAALPTLGATLPAALVLIRLSSPTVRVFRLVAADPSGAHK